MRDISYVQNLVEQKKKSSSSEEDLKRIEAIESFLLDRRAFVKINRLVGLNILEYLGVPENDIDELYEELTSYDNIKGELELNVIEEEHIKK